MSSFGPLQVGAVAALWRYPVKSMMGEELNSCEVTDRGLLGDRHFAVVDRATGKVGGAKNPRKWGNFFDFRAAYAQPPQAAAAMPPVRITLPDGTAVTTGHGDLEQVLSRAFGRDVAWGEAQPGDRLPGATAEEYWPDMAGLDYRDLGQGGEQAGQAVAEDGMVIDDQDPGHGSTAGTLGSCAGAVTAGSRAWMVTPGEPSRTVTVPPSSSARSRMMARPWPG